MTKRDLLRALEQFPDDARITLKIEDVDHPPDSSFLIGNALSVKEVSGSSVMICGNNAE